MVSMFKRLCPNPRGEVDSFQERATSDQAKRQGGKEKKTQPG